MPRSDKGNGTPLAKPNPVRLPYLDGLRGIAAVYVVLFHTIQNTPLVKESGSVPFLLGHYAVTIFIVLSGFSLMLPVLDGRDIRTKSEWIEFVKRRGRRILVPYYAAYFLSLVLFVVGRVIRKDDFVLRTGMYSGSPLAWDNIVAHLALMHDLLPRWVFVTPNGPLWSVAVEWQIYGLFPLILLPLWRHYGKWVPVVFGLILGVGVSIWRPEYRFISPWFIGLFALGMAAAHLLEELSKGEAKYKPNRWLSGVTIGCIGCFWGSILMWRVNSQLGVVNCGQYWIIDVLVGVGLGALLIDLEINSHTRFITVIRNLLASKTAKWLGSFSYSLYLTHFIVLTSVLSLFRKKVEKSNTVEGIVFVLLISIASILFAYAFYLLVERRTIQTKPR